MDGQSHPLREEARRRDLTNAAAVIVALPDTSRADWETDPSEAYRQRAELASGASMERARQRFREDFAAAVEHAAAGLLPNERSGRVEARPYATGPAAEGWPMYLVTLLRDVRPYLEDGALLWTLGQAVHALLLKVRSWEGLRLPAGESALTFTEPMLLALIYVHVRSSYHPRANVVLESHVRTDFPGYGEPEHPGCIEHYLIRAKVGHRSYVYQVDSHAIVTEHYRLSGATMTPLPLPSWYEDEFVPRRDTQPVRCVLVRCR